MLRSIVTVLLFFVTGEIHANPNFENRATGLNLTHQYTGGWEYFVGGGVASFDCNGDLFPELFVAGGEAPAILLRNDTVMRKGVVAFSAKTPASLKLTSVTGAYPLDIDSDGTLDLFIMRVGENLILKGGPNCSFGKFEGLGFEAGNSWTTAFSATWEKQNSLPTLAIGNYVDRTDPEGPFEACDKNFLMRPTDGKYISSPLEPGFCALSMLFTDWGRRGRQDLRVSNDRHYYVNDGFEQLWAMEAIPRAFGEKDGWKKFQLWGMGIASRDITGDRIPEVFLSSMGDQKLQMLKKDSYGPTYFDATYDRGTTAHRPYVGDDGRPSTGWHAGFGDMDNDGLDDVFIAKGNVDQMPDAAMADPNNLLMQRPDGKFIESGFEAGLSNPARSRGAALVDLNLDGLLDIVVVNRRAPLEIYQNITAQSGNWLLLNITQNGINPQAIGAWVEVEASNSKWHREITVGGGHASGNSTLMHFGLGTTHKTRLRVIWPDGKTTPWTKITPNHIWQINRSQRGITTMLKVEE